MAATFSRLQLAAALLEYDNDPDSPDVPVRRAQDSAIFLNFRRNIRPQPVQRRSDYLSVILPSEAEATSPPQGVRDSMFETARSRVSRASVDALRNPFEKDYQLDGDEMDPDEAPQMDVDLASWGLDAYIGKDKSAKDKSPEVMRTVPSQATSRTHQVAAQNDLAASVPRRQTRSVSLGNIDEIMHMSMEERRASVASPLNIAAQEGPFLRMRSSSNPLVRPLPPVTDVMVPFPSTSLRMVSPGPADDPAGSLGDRLSPRPPSSIALHDDGDHKRTVSNASSAMLLNARGQAENNPFALRAPSVISRFDPKSTAHARTFSSNTMLPPGTEEFGTRAPSVMSRPDPRNMTRTRTVSNASLGSRLPLDDAVSTMTGFDNTPRTHRMSSHIKDILRPKVLVMPSPLQQTGPPSSTSRQPREGFAISQDGTPLPPGARSSRPVSRFLSAQQPPLVASNSFTPNPRLALSLSQLTFRNTLKVDGRADVSYSDIDEHLPRAAEEGQQVQIDTLDAESIAPPIIFTPDEDEAFRRPAGKLYGKSLIDDVENRKLQMRSKQRVFRGDERPSMMSRSRATTLIDPSTLPKLPQSQRMSTYTSAPNLKRTSTNRPLVNLETGDDVLNPTGRKSNVKAVFGVDTLWEREMAKLTEIEAREAEEAAERKRLEEEQEAKKKRKKKSKKGSKVDLNTEGTSDVSGSLTPLLSHSSTSLLAPPVADLPPVLPDIQKPDSPHSLAPGGDESSSDEDEPPPSPLSRLRSTDDWYAGASDDEDEQPRRIPGVGPRLVTHAPDDDSDEDLPLAATIGRVAERASQLQAPAAGDDSDDDRPLSTLVDKAKLGLPTIDFDNLHKSNDDDDEDNQPLGLRASRLMSSSQTGPSGGGNDDDDRPLGLHPDQQRRTQYLAMQRQQLMMQQLQMQQAAAMQSSMYLNPAMMGSGFFPPPFPPMMMQPVPAMETPSPPPMPDTSKTLRVDRWRRDVAVEGELVGP
ncbi:hypothetical protein FISHEDRAFT_65246 [Fistulina hepatica ATCC 64428]|nr:hypothetical protein FISHEDRAFT_65246 [Fistulina hepatica ATCC 64428]